MNAVCTNFTESLWHIHKSHTVFRNTCFIPSWRCAICSHWIIIVSYIVTSKK